MYNWKEKNSRNSVGISCSSFSQCEQTEEYSNHRELNILF